MPARDVPITGSTYDLIIKYQHIFPPRFIDALKEIADRRISLRHNVIYIASEVDIDLEETLINFDELDISKYEKENLAQLLKQIKYRRELPEKSKGNYLNTFTHSPFTGQKD